MQSTTAFDKADISLTISCYGELPKVISNAVSKFNETDNGYTIEVRDYEQFVGEMPDKNDSNSEEKIAQARQKAYDKFYEDCCAEGELDIISMSTNMAAFEKVIGEGEFAELYTFSDADKAFNISDLNENIIRLCETNGNLFEMPVSFSADFLLGASEYIGDAEWDVDSAIELCRNLPNNVSVTGSDTFDFVYNYMMFLNLEAYFIGDNEEICFSEEDFSKMIEFLFDFPELQGYAKKTDAHLIEPIYMSSFGNLRNSIDKFEESSGKAIFIGSPAVNGHTNSINVSESLAINKNSSDEKQRGAWEFIKLVMSEENQLAAAPFPINNSVFYENASQSLTENEIAMLSDYINSLKFRSSWSDLQLRSDIDNAIAHSFYTGQSAAETIIEIRELMATCS